MGPYWYHSLWVVHGAPWEIAVVGDWWLLSSGDFFSEDQIKDAKRRRLEAKALWPKYVHHPWLHLDLVL